MILSLPWITGNRLMLSSWICPKFLILSLMKDCCKLAHYGIQGTTLKWIRSFLLGRTQKVVLNGQTSIAWIHILLGVHKVWSSALSCPSYDLPNNAVSNLKLYADDALLYRTIYAAADMHIFQKWLGCPASLSLYLVIMAFNHPNAISYTTNQENTFCKFSLTMFQ